MAFEDYLNIRILNGGRKLRQEEDGFLGDDFHKGFVDMHVQVLGDAQILPFMVGGSKGVDLKREVVGDRREVEPGRWYKLRIQIKLTNPPPESGRPAGIPHTEYPANAMRFVEWREGKLVFYSASLVSQHGRFFLIVQEQYDVQCYDACGIVRCPYFEQQSHEWVQLLAVLPDMFRILGVSLPLYVGQEAEPDVVFKNLAPGTAGVEHWDAANGVGGLVLADGRRARVHWTNISRPSRLIYLAAGEVVSYSEIIDPVLTKERGTKYIYEAVGVTVIDEGVERAA